MHAGQAKVSKIAASHQIRSTLHVMLFDLCEEHRVFPGLWRKIQTPTDRSLSSSCVLETLLCRPRHRLSVGAEFFNQPSNAWITAKYYFLCSYSLDRSKSDFRYWRRIYHCLISGPWVVFCPSIGCLLANGARCSRSRKRYRSQLG